MTEISLFRLYLLRAMYLMILVGLALTIWPLMVSHGPSWPLMNSVVAAMLTAVSLLAALGLRYPLRMLPVLLFELGWKMIWLAAVALPLWSAGALDPRTIRTAWECLLGVVLIPLVLPWRYLFDRYLKQPGERWRNDAAATSAPAAPAEA